MVTQGRTVTDDQQRRIDKVFDDLERAGVTPIKAAQVLGITVKNAKKQLKRARERRLGSIPVAGCRSMVSLLARDEAWHSVDLDRTHLTAFARSDSPSRLSRPAEA